MYILCLYEFICTDAHTVVQVIQKAGYNGTDIGIVGIHYCES
jgi:hypothetical protein